MQLNDVLEVLPPRVYLRRGELVIHFSTPADLVARTAETQAAFSELERPSDAGRSESRPRGRTNGRTVGLSAGIVNETTVSNTSENWAASDSRSSSGKED